MGAPYNNLMPRLEDALVAFIKANDDPGSGVNVYVSLEQAAIEDRVTIPCVIVTAAQMAPQLRDVVPDQVGLVPYDLAASVLVRTMAEDLKDDSGVVVETARDRHHMLVGRMMDLFTCGTVAAELNAQGVAGIEIDQTDTPAAALSIAGDHIETDITFNVVARSKAG